MLARRSLIVLSVLFTLAFAPFGNSFWERQLSEHGKMNLPVRTLRQSLPTSCGPASIVMAYNYAYPETRLTEQPVIEFASQNGYFTERKFPYTSPENMVYIAEHYAEIVHTGLVNNEKEAFALLKKKLTGGDPIIIDILTRLDDPTSGAHFVVVTGLEINPDSAYKTKIYYNDPQLGKNRSSYWLGMEGVWNAWQNNGDPGGSGWWMVIPSP
jgi:hypothetical protein